MTLRVFTDSEGCDWHVWNVDPSSGATGVRIDLREGWLCFERVGGGDRCRLALTEAPPAWEQLPAQTLDRLRRAAAARRSLRAVTRDESGARVELKEDAARRRDSGPKRALGGEEED